MFFRTSILFGFMRLCLLVFFIFYVNKKNFTRFKSQNLLEFIINKWFKYGSLLLVMTFVMVQLEVFNFLNLVFLLAVFLLLEYIGIAHIRSPRRFISRQMNLQGLEILKNIENNKSLSYWFRLDSDNDLQKKDIQMIAIVIFLTAISFVSIYYFFSFDLFTFSKLWYTNLERIIGFDTQLWFTNGKRMLGESAIVKIYSQTVNVSPEIAQQSIAILENTLLTLILFWVVYQITPSKFVAPVVCALFFTFAYTIVPVNIYFVLKNNPVFFALTYAIPIMVFILKPSLLFLKKGNYFFFLTIGFLAIGLTNLMVLLVCFPLFISITLVLNCKKENPTYWLSLFSYVISCTLLLGTYWIVCLYQKTDFIYFLHSNLIFESSFTYLPYLQETYTSLLQFYAINSGIGIVIMFLLMWFKKEKWKNAIIFMLFFNGILVLSNLNSKWLDSDLIITMIPVFLPLTIGINAALLVKIIDLIMPSNHQLSKLVYTGLLVFFVIFIIQYQKNAVSKLVPTDKTPKTVLNAYDQISENFIPFTYAVVNDNSAQLISTNKHFFINYEYFLKNYESRDAIYFKNQNNPHFFKINPAYVLPKSVLIFVYNPNKIIKTSLFKESSLLSSKLTAVLENLKQKGRTIKLFYNSDVLQVYEIVNVPKKSKTKDLIYEK